MSKQAISDEQATEFIRDGQGRRWMQERYAIGTGRFERLRAQLARKGVSHEHGMSHEAIPGFVADGYSDFYNEETGQLTRRWMKYKADKQAQHDMQVAAIMAMADDLPKLSPRPAGARVYRSELMACYPIGDLHAGMYSDPAESGEAWDLEIAEQVQCGAMAELVGRAPACEKATIVNLGDWMHASNQAGTTSKSGHALDMAGRFHEMAHVGVKVMRQCIESALAKHRFVHVINITGNHDDTGAILLAICLSHTYENPRHRRCQPRPGHVFPARQDVRRLPSRPQHQGRPAARRHGDRPPAGLGRIRASLLVGGAYPSPEPQGLRRRHRRIVPHPGKQRRLYRLGRLPQPA